MCACVYLVEKYLTTLFYIKLPDLKPLHKIAVYKITQTSREWKGIKQSMHFFACVASRLIHWKQQELHLTPTASNKQCKLQACKLHCCWEDRGTTFFRWHFTNSTELRQWKSSWHAMTFGIMQAGQRHENVDAPQTYFPLPTFCIEICGSGSIFSLLSMKNHFST